MLTNGRTYPPRGGHTYGGPGWSLPDVVELPVEGAHRESLTAHQLTLPAPIQLNLCLHPHSLVDLQQKKIAVKKWQLLFRQIFAENFSLSKAYNDLVFFILSCFVFIASPSNLCFLRCWRVAKSSIDWLIENVTSLMILWLFDVKNDS